MHAGLNSPLCFLSCFSGRFLRGVQEFHSIFIVLILTIFVVDIEYLQNFKIHFSARKPLCYCNQKLSCASSPLRKCLPVCLCVNSYSICSPTFFLAFAKDTKIYCKWGLSQVPELSKARQGKCSRHSFL